MIQEKVLFVWVSFVSTYFLTEISFLELFPPEIFDYRTFLYPFISKAIYSMLVVWRKFRNFQAHNEGVTPITFPELLSEVCSFFIAGGVNFILYALLTSYAISSPEGWFVENIKFIQSKEGLILMGLLVGLLFNFVSSEKNLKVVSDSLDSVFKNWVKKLADKYK